MRVRKFKSITPLSESAKKSVATPTGRVFKGVTLIKSGLGNRRDKNFYPEAALKDGVAQGLFEGLRAFADHPDSVSEEIQPERSIRDMVGVYENAHYDDTAQSVRADLRILRSHSWLSEAIDELIEAGHGDKIGLSINGRGETEPTRHHLEEAGGDVEVNELKRFIELRSTDVVTEAGAGGGFSELLESARRARESGTMKKSEVFVQLREAVRKGDTAKAKELEKKLDTAADDVSEADDDDDDETEGRKTKEMGSFAMAGKMKKKRPTYEAAADTDDAEDDEDDEDEVDHDAALDEAAEDAREDGDDEDEGEDGDDLDEAEGDDEDDEDEAEGEDAPVTRRAQEKFHRSREAAVKGALGKPTGTVTSGDSRFTTKARNPGGSGSRLNTKTTMGFKRGRKGKKTREAEGPSLATQNAILREQNARLRENITRQQSINTATRLLKEDDRIPKAVRPHLLRDLIGLSKRDMLAEINKQASILEAAAQGAIDRLGDDFDEVEGAGATTIRESYFGRSRDDGEGLGDLLAESGLPMKRG